MSTQHLPADLSETPLWRLLVLLDDLERERGTSAPETRRVVLAVSERLGIVTEFGAIPQAEAADAAR